MNRRGCIFLIGIGGMTRKLQRAAMNRINFPPGARFRQGLLAAGILFLLCALTRAADRDAYEVGPVPEELRSALELDPFYKKYASAKGLPVLSSEKVSDFALKEAVYLLNQMFGERDDIRQAMIENKVRFVIMAPDEFTTMVPEQKDMNPAKYWDKRARGLGASRRRPVVSCGEENLLGYDGDPYLTENILIHEFAHAMHGLGLREVDPTFDRRLREAYRAAMDVGLWKGTYAAVNHSEYFAEGVQSWFETNRENDAQHNHVNTREELREYDPALAKLVEEVYGDRLWRYQKPPNRSGEQNAHLKGMDLKDSPKFSWPKELLEWNQEYARNTRRPESELVVLPLIKPDTRPISEPVSTLRDSSILFINERSEPVTLYKLSPMGERGGRTTLDAGEKERVATFAGQTWLAVGANDQEIGMVVSSFEPAKATINEKTE